MKKIYALITLLLASATTSFGQNLVPNHSFETFSVCPSLYGEIHKATGWMSQSDSASADYMHACANGVSLYGVPKHIFGYQNAHVGNGYAHILLYSSDEQDYREYIQIKLTQTLVANECYYFQMHVSLSEIYTNYTTDVFGAYFSDTLIDVIHDSNLPFTPQVINTPGSLPDTTNWKPVQGIFTAKGGESYIIIGNFKNDQNTPITFSHTGPAYQQISIYIDDVYVLKCAFVGIEGLSKESTAQVFPNPFTQSFRCGMSPGETATLRLYDTNGRLVHEQWISDAENEINAEHLAQGIYYYMLQGNTLRTGKIVKE